MVGIVSGIVIGTIAGMAVGAGLATFSIVRGVVSKTQKNITAKIQNKIYMSNNKKDLSKKDGKDIIQPLIKMYKTQKRALKLGFLPLAESSESFAYPVNEEGYRQLLQTKEINKQERKLLIAKTDIKLDKLEIEKGRLKKPKNKKRQIKKDEKLKKQEEALSNKNAGLRTSVLKEKGMTAGDSSGGGSYVNQIMGYGTGDEAGVFSGGVDDEIRYKMCATSFGKDDVGYDPNDIFKKAQKKYRNKHDNTSNRWNFVIDYKDFTKLNFDEFRVGTTEMIGICKLPVLANACIKINELHKAGVIGENQEVMRIVEDSREDGTGQKGTKQLFSAKGLAGYLSGFMKSKDGQEAIKKLEDLDSAQAQAIEKIVDGYIKKFTNIKQPTFGTYEI